MKKKAAVALIGDPDDRSLKGVRVSESMLVPAVDSTQPFKQVVDVQKVAALGKLKDRVEYGGMTALSGAVLTPLLVAGTTGYVGPHTSFSTLTVTFGISLAGAVGALIPTYFTIGAISRKLRALSNYSEWSLKQWLWKRYNISQPQLPEYTGSVLNYEWEPGNGLAHFADGGGKKFMLMAGGEGLYVKEVPEDAPAPAPKDYAPSGTVAALSPVQVEAQGLAPGSAQAPDEDLAELLMGDAQMLHSRTVELLATLAKRSLSAESQHVIKRVQEDLRQTLHINRELQEIGAEDEISRGKLAAVLSALNDELDEVLELERKAVRDTLSTQLGYVNGRRRHISALQLPMAAQPVKEIEQKVDQA